MATRPILAIGHPLLRQTAAAVDREQLARPETQLFIDELIETMRTANGAGLAATQVGEMVRICSIEVQDNPRYPYKPNIPLTVLVNPTITVLSEERFTNFEGCLSVPDLRGQVPRATEIRVRAWDRHGADIDFEVRGLTAGTYQHEVDHLDGVLFVDRVEDTQSLCTWEQFERHHQARFAIEARQLVARWGA